MSVKELIFDVRLWSRFLWLGNLAAKIWFVFDFFFLFVFFGFFILTSLGWALNFVLGIWGDLYFTIFWPCLIHFDLCFADVFFFFDLWFLWPLSDFNFNFDLFKSGNCGFTVFCSKFFSFHAFWFALHHLLRTFNMLSWSYRWNWIWSNLGNHYFTPMFVIDSLRD